MSKLFKIGNDHHVSNKIVKINIKGKNKWFHVVPDNFQLPEDGIVGLLLFGNYDSTLTHTHLKLNNHVFNLIEKGIFIEPNTIKLITLQSVIKNGHIMILNHENIDDDYLFTRQRPQGKNPCEKSIK